MVEEYGIAKPIFKSIFFSVLVIVSLYAIFYFVIGAKFAFYTVLIGILVFSPICYLLEQKSYHRSARLLLVFLCNYYIYFTSLGFGHTMHNEFYLIPSLMVALLICNFEDKYVIRFGAIMPIVVWLLMSVMGKDILDHKYIHEAPYSNLFAQFGFFGSFGLAAFFLTTFIKTIKMQRVRMISAAKMSSLGEMASGIAHEINNPLTVISCKAEQMRMRVERGNYSNSELENDLKKIENTTMRIARIISGLRSFSRDSENEEFQNVFIKDIFTDTLELCRERIKNQNIDLKLIIPEDLKTNVRPTQISQVLMNLIGNSIDAIENLEEKWIELKVEELSNSILISVKDSGHGIDPQILEKIMLPFFTTKEVGKGTGLGLSISKGIIEDHKGQLIYNSKSENTNFLVYIQKDSQ